MYNHNEKIKKGAVKFFQLSQPDVPKLLSTLPIWGFGIYDIGIYLFSCGNTKTDNFLPDLAGSNFYVLRLLSVFHCKP